MYFNSNFFIPTDFFVEKVREKIVSVFYLCSSGMRRSQSISERIDLFFKELEHKEALVRSDWQTLIRYIANLLKVV
jgi:hypothetical protein